MAEAALDAHISDLFDMLDAHSSGTVPVSTCVDTLRRINPSLTHDAAATLANVACPVGCQSLKRDAFVDAVMRALEGRSSGHASLCVLRDLIRSLRLAHRERYLMMNIDPNTPLPSLTENPNVVALFRELFAAEAHDEIYITRPQLRRLMLDILPDDNVSVANVLRAAMSEDDSDLIGFYEFITLMRPITLRRPLGDLVDRLRCRRAASGGRDLPPCSSPAGIRTKTAGSTCALKPEGSLDAELQIYRRWDAEAQLKFAHTCTQGFIGMAPIAAPPTSGGKRNAEGSEAVVDDLQSEVVRLRRENESLRHDLLVVQTQKPLVRVEDGERVVEMSGEEFFDAENAALRTELAETKERLRACQAIIGLHGDITDIGAMLRRGCTAREALLAVYPEEAVLYGRHQQLLRLVERQQNAIGPPGCPARLLLTQFDAILQGYQTLYRHHRDRVDGSGVAPMSACRSPTRSVRSNASSVDAVLQRRRKPWVD